MTPLASPTSLPQRADLRSTRAATPGKGFEDAFHALQPSSRSDGQPAGAAAVGSTSLSNDGAPEHAKPDPQDGAPASAPPEDDNQPVAAGSLLIKVHGPSSALFRAQLHAATIADAPAAAPPPPTAVATLTTDAGQADGPDGRAGQASSAKDEADAKTPATKPAAGGTSDPVIGSLAAWLGAGVALHQTAQSVATQPAKQAGADPGGPTPGNRVSGAGSGATGSGLAAIAPDASVASPAAPALQPPAAPARAVPAKAPIGVGGPVPSRAASAMTAPGVQTSGSASAGTSASDASASDTGDDTAALVVENKIVAGTGGEVQGNAAPAPTHQVLAALRSLGLDTGGGGEGGSGAPASSASPLAAPGDTPTTSLSPLRSVTIQLQPAHLGDVALTVQRQDGVLAVTVTVGNSRALRTLEKDRDLLDKAVEAAGGSRDTLALTLAAGARDAAAPVPAPSTSPGTFAGAPGDMSQGREAGRDRRAEPATLQSRIEDEQRPTDGAAPARVDRGLYL